MFNASLCNQLNNTSSRYDLSLCLLANPACAHYQWYLWDSALAEDFAVAEGGEVEDGDGVGFLAGDVLSAELDRDEGPELWWWVLVIILCANMYLNTPHLPSPPRTLLSTLLLSALLLSPC